MKKPILTSEKKYYENIAPTSTNFPKYENAEFSIENLPETTYAILFEEQTEQAFSHPLYNEKRNGIYKCAGCSQPLFEHSSKYDSGSGWPSFFAPIDNTRLLYQIDEHLGYPRTEVTCSFCHGHLGHVFHDGPRPTGLRYCMNGGALSFEAKKE